MHSFNKHRQKGFTVAELITVIFIVTIISAVIISNQSSFGSGAQLRNLADNLGLSIRQAQVYGIAVRDSSPGTTGSYTSINLGYGVVFRVNPGYRNSYRFFADIGQAPPADKTNSTGAQGNLFFNNCSTPNAACTGANNNGWACTYPTINPSSANWTNGYECIPPLITIPANYQIMAICAVTQFSPYAETCSDDIGSGGVVDPSIFEVDIVFRRPNTEASITFNRDALNGYTIGSYGTKIVLSTLDGSKKNSVTVYKTGQISVK